LFIPLPLLTALVALLSIDWVLGPASPEQLHTTSEYLFVLASCILLLWLSYELATVLKAATRGRRSAFLELFRLLSPQLPTIYYVMLLYGLRWDAFVGFELNLRSQALSLVVLLAPFLVLELLAALGQRRFEGESVRALDRLRATWTLLPMLPLLFGWFDLLDAFVPTRAFISELSLGAVAAVVIGFGFVVVLLPVWFVFVWGGRKLPYPPLEESLWEMAREMGVSLNRISVLSTGYRVLNAGVVGPVGFTRQFFFTDLMTRLFGPEQIQAVFAHELAHIKRRHLERQLLFFVLLPVLAAAVITASDWIFVAFIGVMVVLAPLFVFLNRRFEHEADLFGARFLGGPSSMIDALVQVEMMVPERGNQASWRHPSSKRRIELLAALEDDPEQISSWQRRTRNAQAVLFLVLGLCATLFAFRAWNLSRKEVPGFLLATGHPRAAFDRYSRVPEPKAKDEREDWSIDIDQATRAVRVMHDLPAGLSAVPVLEARAVQRGLRALRRGHRASEGVGRKAEIEANSEMRDALGWLRLAVRLDSSDRFVVALCDYLQAREQHDRERLERAKSLLRFLPTPPEMREVVADMVG